MLDIVRLYGNLSVVVGRMRVIYSAIYNGVSRMVCVPAKQLAHSAGIDVGASSWASGNSKASYVATISVFLRLTL